MNALGDTTRRTVLNSLGTGVVGGTALAGSASGHGDDEWGTPAWLLTDVWEMADREPSGEDPTDHNSHVPIYYIAPDADPDEPYYCPQVEDREFREWANLDNSEAVFEDGAWKSVDVDQTLHDLAGTEEPPTTEFTVLWHVHFVFDSGAEEPYRPDDLVNEHDGNPLINSGYRIRTAWNAGAVDVVPAPFVFNCPGRPARGDHQDYCGRQSSGLGGGQ